MDEVYLYLEHAASDGFGVEFSSSDATAEAFTFAVHAQVQGDDIASDVTLFAKKLSETKTKADAPNRRDFMRVFDVLTSLRALVHYLERPPSDTHGPAINAKLWDCVTQVSADG